MFKRLAKAEALKGNRTKILSFLILFVLGGLRSVDVIDDKTFQMLIAVGVSAGLLTSADHDKKRP